MATNELKFFFLNSVVLEFYAEHCKHLKNVQKHRYFKHRNLQELSWLFFWHLVQIVYNRGGHFENPAIIVGSARNWLQSNTNKRHGTPIAIRRGTVLLETSSNVCGIIILRLWDNGHDYIVPTGNYKKWVTIRGCLGNRSIVHRYELEGISQEKIAIKQLDTNALLDLRPYSQHTKRFIDVSRSLLASLG